MHLDNEKNPQTFWNMCGCCNCGCEETAELNEDKAAEPSNYDATNPNLKWDVPEEFFDKFEFQGEEQESDDEVAFTTSEELAMTAESTATEPTDVYSAHTWVADSGASCHMINNDSDLYDVRPIDNVITIGSGKQLKATKVGKVKRMVRQKDGTLFPVTLEVKYVPGLWINLFSLTKAMQLGSQLSNEGLVICISRKGKTIRFDKIFKTKTGFVGGVDICPVQTSSTFAHFTLDKGNTIDYNKFHQMMGHVGEKLRHTTVGL